MARKAQNRGLGKGLGAIIRTSDETPSESAVMPSASAEKPSSDAGLRMVAVSKIRPNPHQPRSEFDETALQELTESIKEHGLIQPLIVHQESANDYTLIAGERRWRASQRAGLDQVPVVVKNAITALEMLELAIIENVQRADLNVLEEGLAYKQLMDEFGFTQAEVAKRMGKSRSAVANLMRLLDLPMNVQEAVVNKKISGGHARAILPLDTVEQQTAVMNSIIQNEYSVRQTEDIVRKMLARVKPKKKEKAQPSAEMADLERQFRNRLGTRVHIEQGKKGGKIVIHYYSDEEFNAIYDEIIREGE